MNKIKSIEMQHDNGQKIGTTGIKHAQIEYHVSQLFDHFHVTFLLTLSFTYKISQTAFNEKQVYVLHRKQFPRIF